MFLQSAHAESIYLSIHRSPRPRSGPILTAFFLLLPLPLLQAHADVFGGDFDGDGIDDVGMDYESKYDDFM